MEHRIRVFDPNGQRVPDPVATFRQAALPPQVLRAVEYLGFSAPTPIQAQVWPIANAGRDLVGIAKTGSANLRIACNLM